MRACVRACVFTDALKDGKETTMAHFMFRLARSGSRDRAKIPQNIVRLLDPYITWHLLVQAYVGLVK